MANRISQERYSIAAVQYRFRSGKTAGLRKFKLPRRKPAKSSTPPGENFSKVAFKPSFLNIPDSTPNHAML